MQLSQQKIRASRYASSLGAGLAALAVVLGLTIKSPARVQENSTSDLAVPAAAAAADQARPSAAAANTPVAKTQEEPQTNPAVAAQEMKAPQIIIEAQPEAASHLLVQTLRENGNQVVLRDSEIDRAGKPTSFHAIIEARPDTPHHAIAEVMKDLVRLKIHEFSLRTTTNPRGSVIVIAPANAAWRHVKQIEEALQKSSVFAGDVRVAANNDPVTPTGPISDLVNGDQGNDPPTAPTSPQPFGGLPAFDYGALGMGGALGIPASAIPGRSWVADDKLIIAISDDGKQAYAYSEQHPRWAPQKLAQLPGVRAVPIVGEDVAVVQHGNFCHAYSSVLGMWDLLTLPAGEVAVPSVFNDSVSVNSATKGDFVFKNTWGKWFSAEEIKSGKVAEHLDAQRRSVQFTPAPRDSTVDETAKSLHVNYRELEQRSRETAIKLRKLRTRSVNAESVKNLKTELRAAVEEAYDARLKLHQAELAQFTKRLQDIQQSLETRQSLRQQIIDRRVEELLNPSLQWEPPVPGTQPAVGNVPTQDPWAAADSQPAVGN